MRHALLLLLTACSLSTAPLEVPMITSTPATSPLTPAAPPINPFAQFTQGFEAPTPPPTEIGVSGFEQPTPPPTQLPDGTGTLLPPPPGGYQDAIPQFGGTSVGAGPGQPGAPMQPGGGDFQMAEQGMLPGYRPVKRRPFGAGGY